VVTRPGGLDFAPGSVLAPLQGFRQSLRSPLWISTATLHTSSNMSSRPSQRDCTSLNRSYGALSEVVRRARDRADEIVYRNAQSVHGSEEEGVALSPTPGGCRSARNCALLYE